MKPFSNHLPHSTATYPVRTWASHLTPSHSASRPYWNHGTLSSPPFTRLRATDSFHIKLRMYVTTGTNDRSNRALLDELHRLSHRQENSQSSLGPFLMPRGKVDEQPLRIEELSHWSLVSWSERFRRVFRMARNLVIVSFGGCLGLLVVYSITSELFAPSSTTNLTNMTIKTLEESEKLHQILKAPFKFHTTTMPSTSTQHKTGTIELRFWIESHKPAHPIKGDWKTLEWWKDWITPLITSQLSNSSQSNSNQNQSLDSISGNSKDNQHSHRAQTGWWPGLLTSVMPNTFGSQHSHPSTAQRSWSDRFFSYHGSFDHGEVIAELIKESSGQWRYKTLVIDFPDSHALKYRLDVSDELRKRKLKDQPQQEGATRYRFWSRRISL